MSSGQIGRRLATIVSGSVVILAIACVHWVMAQEPATHGIEIVGDTITAGTVTADEIFRLPAVEQEVRYQTSKGEASGRYKGPLLWSILDARGIVDLPGHGTLLKHSFVVVGRDGYRIVFSFGEIDPDFGNAPIQLATERDGKPLATAEGYRLVVPGDKRGARYVRDVVKIEVQ